MDNIDNINENRNRIEGNNRDFTRIQYKREMQKEKKEGIPRNDRAGKLSEYFNNYINAIKFGIENLNNDSTRQDFTTRIRGLSNEYPDMFTGARERFPRLFGEEDPDLDPGVIRRSELIERIRKNDDVSMTEKLKRFQRDRDEITVRRVIGEIKDLFRDLKMRLIEQEITQSKARNTELQRDLAQERARSVQLQEELVEAHKKTITLLTEPISTKLQRIRPLRSMLESISTTLLQEPIENHPPYSSPVGEFGIHCDEVTRTLDNVQSVLGDTSEHRYDALSQMAENLEPQIRDLEGNLDRTLDNAEKDLRSKLLTKAEVTFNTINEVRDYWEPRKEEMIKSNALTREEYEEIEYSLIAMSTDYFEERVEFSSSPTETETVRKTKLSPEAEGLLDRITKILPDDPHRARELESSRSDLLEELKDDFSRLDRNYADVSQIKEVLLDHQSKLYGDEGSQELVVKVNDLQGDWNTNETEIKRMFGEDAYGDGMAILQNIAAKNYIFEGMTLELAREVEADNYNLRSIKVKLDYTINRAEMTWLENLQYGQQLVAQGLPSFVPDMIGKACSLDQWVRGNDPRITPDIIEKIGQLLTQANRVPLTSRSGDARQELFNLNFAISTWDDYRERGGRQPPIYLRDLLPEARTIGSLFLIDPSKITQRRPEPREACTSEKIEEMKKDRNEQLDALQEELEKKWTSILENNPTLKRLFKGFSPDDFWRLCIDRKFQQEDPISSSDAMQVNGHEFEPYFLVGTMKGLIRTLTGLGKKLTPEYYQLLQHEFFESQIIINEHEGNPNSRRARLGFMSADIWKDNEVLHMWRASMPIPHDEAYNELCQYYDNRYSGDLYYKDQGHPVGRCLADPRRTRDSYTIVCLTEGEAKANLQCVFDKYYTKLDQIRFNIAAQHKCKEWSDDLAMKLSEEETEEIITVIAECYKKLDLGHFLRDGNGRMVNFCIVNKLLLENGLPPAIMEPRCFSPDSSIPPFFLKWEPIERIVAAIRQGQAFFKNWKQPEIVDDEDVAYERGRPVRRSAL